MIFPAYKETNQKAVQYLEPAFQTSFWDLLPRSPLSVFHIGNAERNIVFHDPARPDMVK